MRTNLPVTQKEVRLNEQHLIVSKTDLKGIITYANQDFANISGYSVKELVGAPHNIVRHPDMPPEAFQDLWDTLKAGRPWTGYVKNRCKNGDYYWVLANAAPIVENGQITGYVSVRRTPSREMVEAHEKVYKLFREKQQGGLKIRYGKGVKPGLLDNWHNKGIGTKLWTGISTIILMSTIAIASSWLGMQGTKDRFSTFIEQDQKLLDGFSQMYAQGLQMGQAIRNIILDPSNPKAFENLGKAKKDFKQHFDSVRATAAGNVSINQSLDRIANLHEQQIVAQQDIISAVKSGDRETAQTLLNEKDTPIWRDYKKILLDERTTLGEQALQSQQHVQKQVEEASLVSTLAGLLAAVFGMLMGWLLTRAVRKPMREMDDTFVNILQGNYSNVIDISRDDEIGKAMQGLQILQTRMGFEVSEAKHAAEKTKRIITSLDASSAAITIADADDSLIYLSPAARKLMQNLGGKQFNVDALMGDHISRLFNDPETIRLIDEAAQRGSDVDFLFKEHHIHVSARPILAENGSPLGRVSQWQDRTVEVKVEREVQGIVQAASSGDFASRIDLADKEGFIGNLSRSINLLLNTTRDALQTTSAALNRVAKGDLTQTIDSNFQGIFGQLKDDTNTTVERLREVVHQITESSDAINTAAREIAAGNTDLSKRTETQATSLEQTASSLDELTSTVKQNADNARQANQMANAATEVALKGGQVVGQVVNTMGAISDSSKKIADIITVIDGIAFQTNILALNASVEAARAGEQGRGFAVVAGEVRNLAQRSAAAAKEIKELISDSVIKVDDGYKLVESAGKTMREIVDAVKRVTDIMGDITAASVDQSQGISRVNSAVIQMDEMTQQNAALVEQAAATAVSLQDLAGSLAETVSVFKVNLQTQVALATRKPAAQNKTNLAKTVTQV